MHNVPDKDIFRPSAWNAFGSDKEGASHKPQEISGGQKQRASVLRGALMASEVILADEPTGAQDEETEIKMFDLLSRISQSRLVILVTHNRVFADRYC